MHTWLSLDAAVADRMRERQQAAADDARVRHYLAAARARRRATAATASNSELHHTGPRHLTARALRWLAVRLDPSLAHELRVRAAAHAGR